VADNTGEPLRPLPALGRDAHKASAGRVLLLAGSETMPGAAVLCARAAQRGGAGLVAVGCFDENPLRVIPAAAPEAILFDLRRIYRGGRIDWPDELEAFAPHAVLLGPGLGANERTRALLETTLRSVAVPLVVDADGLNVCAGEPELLATARDVLVTTPHPGEARRLSGVERTGAAVPDDDAGRRQLARTLARRTDGICCLKGAATVIADSERSALNSSGNPALATAGSGDVLAGLMSAYLARTRTSADAGWTPFAAVRGAVHVHGLAGDLAARERGEAAVIASDVIEALAAAQMGFAGDRGAEFR